MKKNKMSFEKTYNLIIYVILWILALVFYKTWVLPIFIILHLVVLVFMLVFYINNNAYTSLSRLYYIHHFGAKRRGKDLSFQLSIIKRFNNKKAKKREINYLSNVDYGYGCKLVDLDELKLIDIKSKKVLTYQDIIDGTYKKMRFEKIKEYEGLDLYISDAQLGLPNTEHNALDKQYPWLGPFIALAGQLYNMNIHINTQEYVRLWVKLRGQQDIYVKSLKTLPMNKSVLQKIWRYIPFVNNYIFMKVRIYDNVESAERGILPFNALGLTNEMVKHGFLSSGQATKEQFESTYGKIKERTLVINRKKIYYDSRIFHEYLFGYKYTKS